MRDGIIFAVGQTQYRRGVRVETNDVGKYDVVIESAAEADQGLYQCQAQPSGFRVATYLWVDGTVRAMFYCSS